MMKIFWKSDLKEKTPKSLMLAIILALALFMITANTASATVKTSPESVTLTYEDTVYTITVDNVGTDESGNTTVTLAGLGDSLMIRDGEMIMHIEASFLSGGAEYGWQNASVNNGKATYTFDVAVQPEIILVYSYDKPEMRKEFVLGGNTESSTLTMPDTSAFEYTLEDGFATITAYTGSGEYLNIPAELDGYPVNAIGFAAFEKCESSHVTIPDGVTSIGDYAFFDCEALSSVTIPASTLTIGEYAFTSCPQLVDVTLTEGIESIGEGAFQMCFAMKTIAIPESVNSIGEYAFDFCSSLSEIQVAQSSSSYMSDSGVLLDKSKTLLHTYPAGRTGSSYKIPKGVKIIGAGAFAYCETLRTITIPDSVTEIGDLAFNNSLDIKSISIPKSVESIGEGAFAGCINLSAIAVSKDNTAFVSQKGILFDIEGKNLLAYPMAKAGTSYKVPDGVEGIGAGAFESAGKLKSITLPDSIKSVGDDAFNDCDALTAITIPEGVESIGEYAFAYCESLTSLALPASVESIGADVLYQSGKCRLLAPNDSYAQLFAKENDLPFDLLP